jgi:hypothetical protein
MAIGSVLQTAAHGFAQVDLGVQAAANRLADPAALAEPGDCSYDTNRDLVALLQMASMYRIDQILWNSAEQLYAGLAALPRPD